MAPERPAVLQAEGICVGYRSLDRVVPAVVDVSLTVSAGAFVALAGPSGSGKSSLLRVLGLLDRPTRGSLSIAGNDVLALSERRRRRLRRSGLAYVHQRPVTNLVDDLTSAEQIAFVCRMRGLPPTDPHAVLARFGLEQRAASRPAELSGGEQQRLAIAMASAGRPMLLLADEPTAELDRHHAASVIEAIVLAVAGGQTVVAATHDPEVIAVATHTLRLAEGRLVTAHD